MTQEKANHHRKRVGAILAAVGGITNLLLAGLKILVGILSDSAATLADGINNLSDFLGFGVAFFGFWLASKPADRKHPYGHARMEYLSGLAISALILFMGLELCLNSIQKLFHPETVKTSPLFWASLFFSLLVKGVLSLVFYRFSKKLSSQALRLSAVDSRNDIFATGGVMLSGALGRFWEIPLDGAVGLGISVFILVGGVLQTKKAVSPLLGEADEKTRKKILDCVKIEEPILGWHDLLIHDYGPGKCYASLHLEISSDADAILCHEIVDEIERTCLAETGVDLIIHCDPAPKEASEEKKFTDRLEMLLQAVDPRFKLHDLSYSEKDNRKILSFHIQLPREMEGMEKSLRKQMEKALKEEGISSLSITFEPQ